MKIIHFKNVELEQITDTGIKGTTKRVLISPTDGAANFTMRMFHVDPGGHTFHHTHNFEHEIFVTEGNGEVISNSGTTPIEQGFAIFIAPEEKHQIRNTGNAVLTFLCLMPNEK